MANINELISDIETHIARGGRTIIAFDGMAAAGKSTLAAMLAMRFSCNVVPMDHFFLRPEQRTPERYDTPGGNIDYERFVEEVARPLVKGERFSYRPLDCMTFELSEPIEITPNRLTIIEGVYSLHPEIGIDYDITVFFKLDKDEQLRRLKKRSPSRFDKFVNFWLPLEAIYYDYFSVEEKCKYVLDATEYLCAPAVG